MLTPACVCSSTESTTETVHGLPMLRCSCGILRQAVEMTPEQYADWYRVNYHDGVYRHSYDHDRRIAGRRLDAYALRPGAKLLDIGSGNNAFVDEANERGLDAWGAEPGEKFDAPRTYVGTLHGINFPALHFDVITIHDVLEHVPDMRGFLREVARMMKRPSTLIIDFPRFHDPAGEHHWKPTEHLWMLDEGQLWDLLKSEGFRVETVAHPIPSKIVVTATALRQPSPVKILVPPGIGDGFWVFIKLRGFLEERGIYLPELYVHGAGPHRSDGFWSRVPFVRFAGYADIPRNDPAAVRAYQSSGHAVQRDVHGFDYFLSLNGDLDGGRSVDEGLPGPVNWREPLFQPKAHAAARTKFREKFGDYVVTAFFDKGFYQRWLAHFGENKIVETLKAIADAGKTVVIMGAEWDQDGIAPRLAEADPRFVSLVGETSFDELTGLIDGAAGVLGFPAGNTMIGPYYGKPTLLLWDLKFPPAFWTNTVAPDAEMYAPVHVEGATPEEVAETFLGMLDGKKPTFKPLPPTQNHRARANVLHGKILQDNGRSRTRKTDDLTKRRSVACGMELVPGTLKIQMPVSEALAALGEPVLRTEQTSHHGALCWWPAQVEVNREVSPGFVIRHDQSRTPFLEFVSPARFHLVGNGWPAQILIGGALPVETFKASAEAIARNQPEPPPVSLEAVARPTHALVLGGADCVWEDLKALEALMGRPWDGIVIAANDIGSHWPGRLDHWVTLHPENFTRWIQDRRANGYPDGFRAWTPQNKMKKLKGQPNVPHTALNNIGAGSSGMFGVAVALQGLGCTRVICAGIPMTKTPHFEQSKVQVRGRKWEAADAHWKSWKEDKTAALLKGRVKSMSGRTMELLGMPTPEWLAESEVA